MKRLVNVTALVAERGTKQRAENEDLIVPMAFSSEEPVERWWGIEVLDHSAASVRIDRLNDGAPVLFNHNPNDLRGTHEKGSVRVMKDRVLRGDIRITAATQAGRDAIGLVERNVLTKASIGYRIHKVIEESKKRDGTSVKRELPGATFERLIEEMEAKHGRTADRSLFVRSLDAQVGKLERADDDIPTYRVMDWEPIENSLVTIPADNTVGIGRAVNTEQQMSAASATHTSAAAAATTKRTKMEKTPQELAAEREAAELEQKRAERAAMEKREREATEELRRAAMDPMKMEQSRQNAIRNLAKANKIPENVAQAWIGQGYTMEQVSNDIVRILEERGKNSPQSAAGSLGLSQRETQQFSFTRAIKAVADGDWSQAGFEAECSRSLAQKLGRVVDPKAFLVPFEVLRRPIDESARLALEAMGKRDLTAAAVGAGGYLVATDNVGFIEMLRNRSVAFRMGVRQLSGLQGNVTIPRQSAAATAFWLANEATAITESQQTFVQVALSPKTAGAYTEISRQLLLQSSPGAEGIVVADLAAVIALAADLAVLEGTGAGGQPTGISGTSGIGAIGALTSIDFAKMLSFQTNVAGSNVTPVRGGYVTTPNVAALLMQRVKYANTASPLWDGNVWDSPNACGFPGMASLQPTAGTVTFGDWQECVVGEWGVLEVSVNPYANFAAGIIGVRAMYSLDVGVRRPFAFARGTAAT